MTIFMPTLYTVTETRRDETDEWFFMTAPLEVISTHLYLHPEAGMRIRRECAANDGKGVCNLYNARSHRVQGGDMFKVRLHSVSEFDAHAKVPA